MTVAVEVWRGNERLEVGTPRNRAVLARLLRQARAAADPRTALDLVDEALGLWRGPAYTEFAHTLWARGEATGLQELQLGATERRLDTLLALGLYRSARQGDALAVLAEARRSLAAEPGVDPGPALEAEILAQTSELDLPPAPVVTRKPVARLRCLGRDDQLAAAGAAMAAAESGTGGSLLFDGVPGAGRTQLLRGEALADMRGLQVAQAQAHPLSGCR
ncbi:BTAD domain-containing putative transcriptional regulator [Nonomuraea sp. NPDC001636]|uniref:AfsR/SARP family transcriptional regulator n=1 Tax=Nonomuraea sp. NPDC001636 TaxID=3154391 RepID=UPI00332FB774